MVFTRAFVLERKCTYAWGEQAAFFRGDIGPKKHFSGTGPVTLVWGPIFAWVAQFSLRRHKQ